VLRSRSSLPVPSSESGLAFLWLVRFRWIFIACQLLSIAPGLRYGFIDASGLPAYVAVALGLAAFNALVGLWARRLAPDAEVASRVLFLHLTLDLVAVTASLFLSGGVWNPWFSFLFLHAGISALLLPSGLGFAFFTLLAGSFFILHNVPLPYHVRSFPVSAAVVYPAQLLVAFAIWRLITSLAEGQGQLRARLTDLRDRAGRMDRLRAIGAASAGFSHEFATPLNTIRMRLDRLRRRLAEGHSVEEDLQVATAAIDRCERVLRSLNDHRIQPEGIVPEDTPALDLLEGILREWRAENPGAPVRTRLAYGPEARFRVPRVLCGQTIFSLLDNARDALGPAGGIIELEGDRVPGFWRLTVRDAGPGIPPAIAAQLGEPFVTGKRGGTGLGLYNAINFARALGGDLVPRNRDDGPGCEVRWTIPMSDGVPGL
jgi:two-component system sensor histidine kinase RegB